MTKHDFYLDDRGEVDEWRHEYDIHNGPWCKLCDEPFCIWCDAEDIEGECPGEPSNVG